MSKKRPAEPLKIPVGGERPLADRSHHELRERLSSASPKAAHASR